MWARREFVWARLAIEPRDFQPEDARQGGHIDFAQEVWEFCVEGEREEQ